VHCIGLGVAKFKKLFGNHAIKQVDRLLSNDNLNVSNCFERTVPYIIGGRKEIVVAMDWTDFDHDKQDILQIGLVISHDRATPLVWKTVNKKKFEK